MTIEVTGIKGAQDALDEALKDINAESELLIALILQGISASTTPYIPIDNSVLANSEVRHTESGRSGPSGYIGYGASYAEYVHNAPGTLLGTNTPRDPRNPSRGNVWSPTGRPRFLDLGTADFIRDDLSSVLAQVQS